MADDRAERAPIVARAVLWEFAEACERDPALAAHYLDARQRWQTAASDDEYELADDALIDVIERFTDLRGSRLTKAEVAMMRLLRNRPDR